MSTPVLNYNKDKGLFYFRTSNPNATKLHGVKCTRLSDGLVFFFPDSYPGCITSLKDFKGMFPEASATKLAADRIRDLKSTPDLIEDRARLVQAELTFPFEPYIHQTLAIEMMLHYNRLGIILEQGLGKTFIAINAIRALKKLYNIGSSIVLCPRVVLANWGAEIEKFSTMSYVIYAGTAAQRKALKRRIMENKPDIIITNYDLLPDTTEPTKDVILDFWDGLSIIQKKHFLRTWVSLKRIPESAMHLASGGRVTDKEYAAEVLSVLKKVPPKLLVSAGLGNSVSKFSDLSFLRSLSPDVMVMDEGSRLKGYKSNRSLATKELADLCSRRYILSGTISLGSPLDVYMPFTILDEAIFGDKNYHAFKSKYCTFSHNNRHIVTGYRNLDILKLRMDPYMLSLTRDECVDMPERIFTVMDYALTPEQVDLYNDIAKNESVIVGGRTMRVDSSILKLTKLMQVLSGFVILPVDRASLPCNTCSNVVECVENDIMPWEEECLLPSDVKPKRPAREYATFPTEKLSVLEELLTEKEEKTIIWAYFRYDLERIAQLLNTMGIKYITADTDRCDQIFEANPDITVFLGQESQGIGITLNSAKRTIYYSQSIRLEHRLQSLDRNYRIGQKEKVLVIDLIKRGSVEEGALNLLQDKEDVKTFVQSKVECTKCQEAVRCFERGIIPFSAKCVLNDIRVAAEQRTSIKVNRRLRE